MLLYHVIIICMMIGFLSSSAFRCSNQIIVRCLTCHDQSSRYLEARPGTNLTLKYEVDNTNFRILTIKYNGTNNRLEVSPDLINDDAFRDERFTTAKFSKSKDTRSVEFTLKHLTYLDNGLNFFYEYKDQYLKTYQCKHTVRLSLQEDDSQFSWIVLGICLALFLLLILLVLYCLWRCRILKRLCPCCVKTPRTPTKDAELDKLGPGEKI